MTTPGRYKRRYQAPFEGTAARPENEDGMSEIVVATIDNPPSPAYGFPKKSPCLNRVLSPRSGARACSSLIKRRLEIVASGKLPEIYRRNPFRSRTLRSRRSIASVPSTAQAAQPNLRNRKENRRTVSFQHFQPRRYLFAERCDLHAFKQRRVGFQPPKCFLKHGGGSLRVVALKMMEGRRHLNQRLLERFFPVLALQPDALPVLVRHVEFLTPVAPQSVGQCSEIPVQCHGVRGYHSSRARTPMAMVNPRRTNSGTSNHG